jgi:hypothetical protein
MLATCFATPSFVFAEPMLQAAGQYIDVKRALD